MITNLSITSVCPIQCTLSAESVSCMDNCSQYMTIQKIKEFKGVSINRKEPYDNCIEFIQSGKVQSYFWYKVSLGIFGTAYLEHCLHALPPSASTDRLSIVDHLQVL